MLHSSLCNVSKDFWAFNCLILDSKMTSFRANLWKLLTMLCSIIPAIVSQCQCCTVLSQPSWVSVNVVQYYPSHRESVSMLYSIIPAIVSQCQMLYSIIPAIVSQGNLTCTLSTPDSSAFPPEDGNVTVHDERHLPFL